jgi:hypothetical protein
MANCDNLILNQKGKTHMSASNELIEQLRDPSAEVRTHAERELRRLYSESPEVRDGVDDR